MTLKSVHEAGGDPGAEPGSTLRAHIRDVVERIRPCITHGEEVELADIVGNRAGIRLSGRYAGFPSAKLTVELIITHENDFKGSGLSLDDRRREFETRVIRWALKVSRGNKSKAAKLLKMKRSTLADRLKRLEL